MIIVIVRDRDDLSGFRSFANLHPALTSCNIFLRMRHQRESWGDRNTRVHEHLQVAGLNESAHRSNSHAFKGEGRYSDIGQCMISSLAFSVAAQLFIYELDKAAW